MIEFAIKSKDISLKYTAMFSNSDSSSKTYEHVFAHHFFCLYRKSDLTGLLGLNFLNLYAQTKIFSLIC